MLSASATRLEQFLLTWSPLSGTDVEVGISPSLETVAGQQQGFELVIRFQCESWCSQSESATACGLGGQAIQLSTSSVTGLSSPDGAVPEYKDRFVSMPGAWPPAATSETKAGKEWTAAHVMTLPAPPSASDATSHLCLDDEVALLLSVPDSTDDETLSAFRWQIGVAALPRSVGILAPLLVSEIGDIHANRSTTPLDREDAAVLDDWNAWDAAMIAGSLSARSRHSPAGQLGCLARAFRNSSMHDASEDSRRLVE